MCGRFALKNPKAVKATFDLQDMPMLAPRYNIAPSQDIAIIRSSPAGRRLDLARWGLIPSWAKQIDTHYSTINARAETVDSKPSFRGPFKHHRCLIPADGFYEWHQENGRETPYHIGREDGAPFGLAGLWDRWHGQEGDVLSCTIIVTEANLLMRQLHERMPVILAPEDYDCWLNPENTDIAALKKLLVPAPDSGLTAWPVSRAVNNPKHDAPDCAVAVSESMQHQ